MPPVGTTLRSRRLSTRRRVLDLRDGTLRTELDTPGGEVSTLTFASLAYPGTAALVAEGATFEDDRGGPLRLPNAAEHGRDGDRWWARVHGSGGAAVAASERVVRTAAARLRLERLIAYATDPRQAPSPDAALEALEAAERLGVEPLLTEQRSAWARRWSAADIRIEGDPELQRAVRFCLFHLMASVSRPLRGRARRQGAQRAPATTDTSSGTPTSSSYRSWPRPTRPPPGRSSATECGASTPRGRLPARGGFRGARFPWESANTGDDVTPRTATGCDRHARRRADRRAGGAHHRRRRLGHGALPGLER